MKATEIPEGFIVTAPGKHLKMVNLGVAFAPWHGLLLISGVIGLQLPLSKLFSKGIIAAPKSTLKNLLTL